MVAAAAEGGYTPEEEADMPPVVELTLHSRRCYVDTL